jgi:serine protease Do
MAQDVGDPPAVVQQQDAAVVSTVAETSTAPAASPAPLDFLFNGSTPGSLDQLRQMEGHVREISELVFAATVNIQMGDSQGTGVIVTSDGYVLTAAHVIGRPGNAAQVILGDGTRLKATALGVNREVDSGMLKIELPEGETRSFPYVELGESTPLPEAAWVIAVGHPGGLDPKRGMVVRVGRVLGVNQRMMRTDCALVGGDSGGPLVDMHGYLVGIHSRIGMNLWDNIHVPVDSFSNDWDQLAASKVIGGSRDPWIGLRVKGDTNEISEISEGGPAAKAGLRVGDLILDMDGAEIKDRSDVRNSIDQKKAGDTLHLTIQRGEEQLTVELEVGER